MCGLDGQAVAVALGDNAAGVLSALDAGKLAELLLPGLGEHLAVLLDVGLEVALEQRGVAIGDVGGEVVDDAKERIGHLVVLFAAVVAVEPLDGGGEVVGAGVLAVHGVLLVSGGCHVHKIGDQSQCVK